MTLRYRAPFDSVSTYESSPLLLSKSFHTAASNHLSFALVSACLVFNYLSSHMDGSDELLTPRCHKAGHLSK
jgi:hypothetical protein